MKKSLEGRKAEKKKPKLYHTKKDSKGDFKEHSWRTERKQLSEQAQQL